MSDDEHGADHPGTDDEHRVTSAMAAFGAQVRPDPGAWDQIDARIDDRVVRSARSGRSVPGAGRRPLLGAAAAVVLLVVAGAVGVRARSTGDEVQVATAPIPESLSIVAVDTDGRLVELAADGTQQRVIYQPGATVSGEYSPLTGPIAVSPVDGTIYAERKAPVQCENTAGSLPVGQIVAISYDDGTTEVVAPVGGDPAVLPGGDRLAYVTSPDRQPCTTLAVAPVVEVVDLRTGAQGSFTPFDPLLLAERLRAEGTASGGVDPWVAPAPTVRDVAWHSDGTLLVLVQPAQQSSPAQVQRVTLDGALGPSTVETLDVGRTLPTGPAPEGSALYADSIEPLVGGGRFVVGGKVREHIVYPDSTEAFSVENVLDVFDTTFQPSDGDLIGTEVALHLDEATTGLIPLTVTGLSSDPTSGRLLVSVFGASAAGGNRLLLWDGSSLSVLGSGYQRAAWYRSPAPATPPPSGVDTLPTITTSLPPGAGTTSTSMHATTTMARSTTPPYPPTTLTPVDVVGTSERPDDAAAIVDAFRAFFERGDRAALEASGVLEPAFTEGEKTVPGGGQGVTVTIDAITFTGPESAEVRFRLDKDGSEFTAPTVGSAVFIDGRWKVSAATMCTLLSRVQIACPTVP
jgi:hypothetical protein